MRTRPERGDEHDPPSPLETTPPSPGGVPPPVESDVWPDAAASSPPGPVASSDALPAPLEPDVLPVVATPESESEGWFDDELEPQPMKRTTPHGIASARPRPDRRWMRDARPRMFFMTLFLTFDPTGRAAK